MLSSVPVLPKDRPEFPGHRKDDAFVGNAGEGGPLFSLPQEGRSMSTTRTRSRFAGVINNLLFGIRFVYFGAQSGGPALEHLGELSADHRTSFSVIPASSSVRQNLGQRSLVAHVGICSWYGGRDCRSSSVK